MDIPRPDTKFKTVLLTRKPRPGHILVQAAASRMSWHWHAGSTYAPEGRVLTESGAPIQAPAEESAVLQTATCCALCNDSTLTYNNGALPCLECYSCRHTLLSGGKVNIPLCVYRAHADKVIVWALSPSRPPCSLPRARIRCYTAFGCLKCTCREAGVPAGRRGDRGGAEGFGREGGAARLCRHARVPGAAVQAGTGHFLQ